MRYLIRRQNRYGQWVHLDTLSVPPPIFQTWESYIGRRFGPGRYHIAVAKEGAAGLRSLKGHESVIVVGWNNQLKDIWDHKPTWEELIKRYGPGDYLVAKLTEVDPMFVTRKGIDDSVIEDYMYQGASTFAGSYIVIKLLQIPSK